MAVVRGLGVDEIAWETTTPGFYARRQKGDAVAFGVKYRAASGRDRWYKVGRYGALTPDHAREEAKVILGEVAKGGDPAAVKQAAPRRIPLPNWPTSTSPTPKPDGC